MKNYISIGILFLFLLLSSCSKDNNNEYENLYQMSDIVVFDGNKDNGAHFSMQLPENSNVISYYAASTVVPDNISEGDCVHIRYMTEDGQPYQSGPIALFSIQQINNFNVETGTKDEYKDLEIDPISIGAAWGMLDRAIVFASLPYTDQKRTLRIFVDEETLENDVPVAYLCHSLNGGAMGFNRNYYLAFNFSELAKKYGFKSVLIRYHDLKNGSSEFKINL